MLSDNSPILRFTMMNVTLLSMACLLPATAQADPPEGFTTLFNGKDLDGWKGLVADPKKRATMTPAELEEAQKSADANMHEHWKVVDGELVFDGKGDSLCTAKDYGDFEMLVDWKILEGGDSGIYLRGSPQVQIWDTTFEKYQNLGADKGSGALWNNQKNARFPIANGDRAFGEWNTFHIKLVGDRLTVKLNGVLVTDNVVMENYWEREKPLYPTGQIELQNHGNTLWFKNIYIRELEPSQPAPLKIGMIGLDTSHCLAFAELINKSDPDVAGCKVTLVYPQGSPDIESSVSRVPDYTVKIKALGVDVIDDLDAMIAQVDAVLLETNDGRPHLAQIIPALRAHKPVFIDKPIAGSLPDAIAIFELAKHYQTPVFSSSSLRFSAGAQAIRNGSIGNVTGCDAYSPCHLEATHPDLFWYGIHGCEALFTVMGSGVESVTRTQTADFDLVTGIWSGGRIGTFRGIRKGGSGYGGTAFGEKGVAQLGEYGGYKPLVVDIVKFFRSGQPPVSAEETIDLYAFMEAADESKRRGFVPVNVAEVKAAATEAAMKKVAELTAAK